MWRQARGEKVALTPLAFPVVAAAHPAAADDDEPADRVAAALALGERIANVIGAIVKRLLALEEEEEEDPRPAACRPAPAPAPAPLALRLLFLLSRGAPLFVVPSDSI